MTILTDTQRLVLSAACERPERLVLPLPSHLKGGAAAKVVTALISRGLVDEIEAKPGRPAWRETGGAPLALIATDAAFDALGLAPPTAAEDEADDAPDEPNTASPPADAASVAIEPATRPKLRPGTKQAKLITMLQADDGATIDEIAVAAGWQPHTVRGAIAGALKKRLGLTVTSQTFDGRGRVYRIRHT